MEIVTGRTGTPHVTSADHRSIIMSIAGDVSAIANAYEKLAVELSGNNTLKIKSGVLLHRGCVSRVKYGTYDEVQYTGGTTGMKRKDLVVARYEHFNDDTEKMDWYVIEGTPDASNPQIPEYEKGNLQYGDTVDDCPFAVVELDGITASVNVLVQEYEEIKRKESFLLNHPVGSIYFTIDARNPGDIYGGTWEAWGTGRVPIGVGTGNDGEFETIIDVPNKMGGRYYHTITEEEVAPHVHNLELDLGATSINWASGDTALISPTKFVTTNNGINPIPAKTAASTESAVPFSLQQPWISCYMWRRTK